MPSLSHPLRLALCSALCAPFAGCDAGPDGPPSVAAVDARNASSHDASEGDAASEGDDAGEKGADALVAGERRSFDCSRLPKGLQTVKLATEVVYENEEVVFDRRGLLVAKKGDLLAGVPASGASRFLSRDPQLEALTLGLRYLPDGDLVVALPAVDAPAAKLLRVRPDGTAGDFFTAADMPSNLPPLIIPNGVHADSAGNVWVGDTATGHVFRVAPDRSVTSIVTGPDAASANGVAFDEARSLLFYAQTGPGTLRRVRIGAGGAPAGAPELVATIAGGRPDGVTLDACGNLYAVDNQPPPAQSKLWRIELDAQGVAKGAPHLLASFDEKVSSATFGAGPGWDATSLYVSSIVGKVFKVRVGVPGATIP
jgi:sugar lactone lactonase YvrE